MAHYSEALDAVFAALSDQTRRDIVHRLGRGPASVGELAAPFDMALPSFLKHVRALEATGVISTRKTGRVRTCELRPERLSLIDHWLDEQRDLWRGRTERLEAFVTKEIPE